MLCTSQVFDLLSCIISALKRDLNRCPNYVTDSFEVVLEKTSLSIRIRPETYLSVFRILLILISLKLLKVDVIHFLRIYTVIVVLGM